MSRDTATDYHRQWLGLVQPVEGLVVSVPVLVSAQVMTKLSLEACERLRLLAERRGGAGVVDTVDLEALLFDELLLAFRPEDFDRGEALPEELFLWVPEGRQEIRPTLALRRKAPAPDGVGPAAASPVAASPAAAAGAAYQMLVWRLPEKLDLDRSETVTGSWDYPPTAKFERLLHHVRVPIGLLSNGKAVRLLYAPHGESSGWITFKVEDMASVGGREILDALVMLAGRSSFFGRVAEARLPALLEESRKRQADVTTALAAQVFGALELLLAGFEAAAERDGGDSLQDALRLAEDPLEGDHLYGGLLTVLLRLVFLLYAEDRGLVPVENELYAENFSVLGLFNRLQEDAGEYPDSMDRRFGAWDRLIALFRMVYFGAEHDDFQMPARRGRLFDPDRYPFLEGWPRGGSAPVQPWDQEQVKVPSIDDGTVYQVLRQLIVLEGQKLSYKALDVEQIGSVYEGLMGYHVVKLASPALCLAKNGFWLEPQMLAELAPNRRESWLQDEVGLARAEAKKLNEALPAGSAGVSPALLFDKLSSFRKKGSQPATAGRLVLQPGSERRRTSSHYTPRSLSGPIVKRTLEPLLAAIGEEPPSERLLELKVCDPAMGSGAFLVEACRFLADQVVAAWTREGRLELIASAHEDVVNHARRLVAQRCLYGVDKNRFAVDLAKLSLWLETLARDLPFTFLDHALRWGDSLVGLDFRQLRGFHWQPEAQETLASRALDEALSEAIELRQRILDLAGEGEDGQKEKENLLRDANDALDHARLIGDLVVGAFFAGKTEKERKIELAKRLTAVNAWLQEDGGAPPLELRQMQREILERLPVFHWMLELPEVFFADRADPLDEGRVNHAAFIDAFVGNPPFAGKNQIASGGGEGYLDWLKVVFEGSHGNADLSAYFFRRADALLGRHGAMGLIATNTIAQGDTRATGLQALVAQGLRIYDATRTLPWPGAAAVTVSVVHLAKGRPAQTIAEPRLDEEATTAINSRLLGRPERPDPEAMHRNRDLSFVGVYVLGMGFTLTPEDRGHFLAKDSRNGERISPYIGGEEVNSSPTQSPERFVVNFGQMSLNEATAWTDLLELLRTKVKPERDRNNRDNYRKFWWQFGESRPGLQAALSSIEKCLVASRVSKHLCVAFQPTDRVFAETVCVFPLQSTTAFSVLQSRHHVIWARLLSSSMKTDLRYSATDCFETFPFPQNDPREEIPALEAIGERLYQARASYLVDSQQGLTTCYNRLKDPQEDEERVLELRRLHEELDRAVLEAYGWSDIEVPPFETPETEEGKRRLKSFEDEIIDRLFVLNAQRAEEERRLGLAAAGGVKGGKKAPAGKRKGASGHEGQGGLF